IPPVTPIIPGVAVSIIVWFVDHQNTVHMVGHYYVVFQSYEREMLRNFHPTGVGNLANPG
ncbi:MAG: hypothetical protein WA958_17755, partial [Tunicatimonas sp.]